MADLFTRSNTSFARIQLSGGMSKTVQVQGAGHELHYIVPLDVYQQIQNSRLYTVEELDTIVQHRRIYDIPLTIKDNGNLAENVRVGNIGRLERLPITPVFLRQYNQVKRYIKQKYDSQEEVDAAYAEVKRMLNEAPTLMDQAYNQLSSQDRQHLQGRMMDIPIRNRMQAPVQPPIPGEDDDMYNGGRKRTRRRLRKRKTRKTRK